MKITIQVLIEGADVLRSPPIQTIDRPRERVEEVGLQTAEAKSILGKLQQIVVHDRSPTTWLARDRARIARDRVRSRVTIRCDSAAPTVMCRYGAPDGIAVNARDQPKPPTAP
jgi:hypothetical protein